MQKDTAKLVIEYAAATFLQSVLFMVIFPTFITPAAAIIAAGSLVIAVVVTFDNFYDDTPL